MIRFATEKDLPTAHKSFPWAAVHIAPGTSRVESVLPKIRYRKMPPKAQTVAAPIKIAYNHLSRKLSSRVFAVSIMYPPSASPQ